MFAEIWRARAQAKASTGSAGHGAERARQCNKPKTASIEAATPKTAPLLAESHTIRGTVNTNPDSAAPAPTSDACSGQGAGSGCTVTGCIDIIELPMLESASTARIGNATGSKKDDAALHVYKGDNPGEGQRGRTLLPIRYSSTARAHCRPSRIAHTTRDWPRRMSPAAKTLSTLV